MTTAYHQLQAAIEASLEKLVPQSRLEGARRLDDAIRYALFPGGKRFRPVLSLVGARIFNKDIATAMPAACAVEFIHTSSLIFDDLPSMDDADLRRGVPVLHRVFGEDVALLAGIALLNQAYAIFGRTPALIHEATQCIGMSGMIGGQALDLSPLDASQLHSADHDAAMSDRNLKTSAMMRLALTAGALAGGVAAAEVEPLGVAGHHLGEAYQICDDLLDMRQTSAETGKTAGQDLRHQRPTHGGTDDDAAFVQVHAIIEDSRRSLQSAYGAQRVAEVMGLIDRLFEKMTAAAGQPA